MSAPLFLFVLVLLQSLDLTGTWKLDPAQSRITTSAGYPGLIASGAPVTLHITHASNGTVVIESQINESHSRIYKPGLKTSTPVGPSATVTATSRWDGRALISEGSVDPVSGSSIAVREVVSLSADGKTLTVDLTTTGSSGTNNSVLVYTKSTGVEPCKSWPTPCKTFGF